MLYFHILITVLPPDEDAQPFENNSVFTNAITSLSIHLANNVSFITDKTIRPQWLEIASNLYIPFDNSTQDYLNMKVLI